ncbi:MAG: Abi family protein [Lachnospiraceae bacterium]|nr:Abi family protein [Lachnospiraceae bacterium]
MINNVPFGLAIEWYSILRGTHKSAICSLFIDTPALTPDEKKEFFIKALSLIKEYRNQIAHGNRTFSIMQLPVLPKKQLLYLSGGILSESEYNNRLGQNDIFAVFMVILLLINDQYLQIFAGISYPYLSPTKKQNLTEKHFMKFLIYQMI